MRKIEIMKRSPKKHSLSEIKSQLVSVKPVNEMRFADLMNGAIVMGFFFAFSLVAWYILLKWVDIF